MAQYFRDTQGRMHEFPDDATPEEIDAATREIDKPQRSMAERYAAAGIDPNQYNSTDGMSTLDRTRAGFAKSFVDTAEGARQALTDSAQRHTGMLSAGLRGVGLGGAADLLTRSIGVPMLGMQQEQQAAVDDRRRLDAPLMDTRAGFLGNLGGQVTQVAVPIPGGGTVKAAQLARGAAPSLASRMGVEAARGGLYSASQGVATGESRLGNTAKGAALSAVGQGVASGLGRVAVRAKDALSPVVRESVELAHAAGIPLHLSQVTNSKALKTVSSALNYLPFSGAANAGKRQQEAFNEAVGRSFGADGARYLTQGVMKDARARIGSMYDTVFDRNNVTLTPDTLRRMVNVEREALENLTADEARVVSNQFQKILRDAGDVGEMAGKKYQSLRGALREVSTDPGIQKYVKKLGKELDDAASQSVGPEDAALLKRANGMYANMRTAEKALEQVKGAAGNVSPASLWNLIKKGSTHEMRKLAEIGQNVLKDPIPDSGTPARELVYRGLGLGGGAAGAATALGLLAPAAKFAAAGITAGRMLNSPAAARLLGQGRPTGALARLVQPAPRVAPLLLPRPAAAKEKKH